MWLKKDGKPDFSRLVEDLKARKANEYAEAGFIRRRRFLNLMSLALITAWLVGLHPQSVSAVVISNIDHPERIIAVAYVVWLWAFVSYFQWLADTKAFYKTRAEARLLLAHVVGRDIKPLPSDKGKDEALLKDAIAKLGNRAEGPKYFLVKEVLLERALEYPPDTLYINVSVRFVHPDQREPSSQGDSVSYTVRAPRWMIFRKRVAVFLHMLFFTHYYTEYWLPILIGLLPLVPIFVDANKFFWGLCVSGIQHAA